MAKRLQQNEMIACVGSAAIRAPDGTPLPSVPLYVIVDAKTVNQKTGLAPGEAEVQGDIAAVLAPMFKHLRSTSGKRNSGTG